MRVISCFICVFFLLILSPALGAMDDPELSIADDKIFAIYGKEGEEYKITVSWRILRLSDALKDAITIFGDNNNSAIPLPDFSQAALKTVFDVLYLHYFNIDNVNYTLSLFDLIEVANCAHFLRVDEKVIGHFVEMLQTKKDAQSLSEDEFYLAIDQQLSEELHRRFASALFEDMQRPLNSLCLKMRRAILSAELSFERPAVHKAEFRLLSPDQRLIVSSTPKHAQGRQQRGQYELRLEDNKTGTLLIYFGVWQANSMLPLFNSDSTMLMFSSEHLKTNFLSLWDLKSGQLIFSYKIPYSKVCSLAFGADAPLALALCYDDERQTMHLMVWDIASRQKKYIQDFDASFDLKNPRLSADGTKIIGQDLLGRPNCIEFLSPKEIAALWQCNCTELAQLNRLCRGERSAAKAFEYLGQLAFEKY